MSSREVTLDGGSPWGFRMHGGADAQLPLRIARVNPGSKAALRGIREGDLISSINGRPTGNLSNAEAHALLRSAQGTLTLGLNQGATGSPKRRSLKQAQDIKEDNSNRISVTSASSSTTTQQINEFKQTNGAHTENKTKGSPFTTPQGAPPNDNEQSRDEKNNVSATAVDKSVISGASDKALLSAVIMADNVAGSSRSRRQRKSRNNRKKSKNVNNSTVETDLIASSCSNESKIKQIETSNKISESNINDVISACKTVEFTTNESKTDDKPVLQEVEFCVSKADSTFKTTEETEYDVIPELQANKTLKTDEFCIPNDAKNDELTTKETKQAEISTKTTEENICDVIPVLQNNKTVESCTSSTSNKVKRTTKKSKQACGTNKTIEETVYDVIPVPQTSEFCTPNDDKNDELTTKETKQAEITSKTLKTIEFCTSNDVKDDVVTSKTTEEMMCDVIPAFQDDKTIKTVEFCTSSTSNKIKRTTKKSKQVCGAIKTIEKNVCDVISVSQASKTLKTVEFCASNDVKDDEVISKTTEEMMCDVIPAFQDDKTLKTIEFCASNDVTEDISFSKQTKELKQIEVTSKTIEETVCDVTPVLQDDNTLKTVESSKVKQTTKKSKQAHGTTKTIEETVHDVIPVSRASKTLKTVDIKDDGQEKMHDVRLAFQDDKTLKTVESCASSDVTESSTSIKQTKESKQVEVTPKTIEETICDVTPSNISNKIKRTTKKSKQAHGTTKTIEETVYDVIPIPQTSKKLKTVDVIYDELPAKETKLAELTSKTTEEIICDVTHAFPDVKTLKTVEFCASSDIIDDNTSSKQTKELKQADLTFKTTEETICDVIPVLQNNKTIESCTSSGSNKVKRTTKKCKQACETNKTIEENVYDVIPVPQASKLETVELCTTNDVKNDELTTNEIITKTAEETICDVTPAFQNDKTLKTIEFCAPSDVTKDGTSSKQTKELKQVEVTLKTIEETICDVTPVLASNDINKSISTTSVAPKTTDNKIEFPKTSEPNKSNTAPESAINSDVISASNKIELSKTSELINETYKVEFPKKLSNMIKSRSLDDDDIKITEITEEINCLSESQAIVSEADSDIEWETVNEIQKQNKQFGKLSIITLPLEEHVTYETSHISPEDERSLRDFLQGLNLVNSPEESAKKIKKRTALPYYQIPRFLDVISEEGSDVSDRDNKQKTVFLPRLFNQDEDDDDDDVFEEADFEQTKLRHKYDDVPILVGTKLINNDSFMKEASWSTSMAETQSGAELVFLEDSSNSLTPSDLLDTVGDVDADDEDDKSFEMEITSSDLTSRASLPTDTEIKSETNDTLPNDNSATPPTETTIDFLQKLLHTFSSDENEIQQSNEVKQSDSARTSESRSNSAQSQCTAVYNPHHSSLTNIAALLREGSCENKTEPQSLRDICIQTLLDLPFGGIVIEELAKVSKSLEEMTCQPPSCTLTSILTSPPPIKSTNSTASSFLPVASPVVQSMGTNIEKWTGMPSEENPNIVVCLSPSQKQFIDKIKTVPHEADSLLDLHRKFIERRTYQDDKPKFKIQVNSNNNYIPFGQNPFGQNPFSQNAFGQTLFGQNIFGQNPLGQNTFGQNPSEQNPLGQHHFGQNPSEQNPLGQNTFGQNPSGQNAFGQNPFLQSAFGRKPLGQNTFGQNPLVQNAFGQIPLEQNSFGQIPLGQNPLVQSSSGQNSLGQNASGHNNIQYDKYIKQLVREVPIEVEKQINKPVNNKIYRNAPQQELGDRLKARHLGEWLNLARNENKTRTDSTPRRYSLPFELYEEQMKYILEKEREIQNEIDKLNEEKSRLETKTFDAAKYQISKKGDIAILSETFPNTEKFREKMYNEYMDKVAEREERKQSKVLKIKISEENHETNEAKHVFGIEDEFMHKVREKQEKLGLLEEKIDQETTLPSPVKVLDGDSLTDVTKLPKHLQEFIDITTNADSSPGVWSPGKNIDSEPLPAPAEIKPTDKKEGDESAPVVWTPRSAGSSPTAERKEFRPVNFESPILKRKNIKQETSSTPESTFPPPWHNKETINTCVTSLTEERRLTSSQSAPAAGLTSLGKLPRAQNPTITLLQKAREGQLPRGASYIEDDQPPSPKPRNKDIRPPLIGPNEILYTVKNEYLSESETEKPKKMADLGSRKFEGIGPTTKDGMPIVLRSEVKDSNQARWYKRMYDTLHRARNDEEYVTVRYKTRRGRYPYTSAGGYLSEPEPNAYDSDAGISANKYATLDRRRYQSGKDKENEYITYTVPRNKYMSASVRHSTDVYKNQPGRIEDYVPGHSSISEKEAKEWWDDVMEIFDGHLEQQKHVPPTKSFMSHALKESGYESDSTLVFRRREDAALQINPHEQKQAYKSIQKGGEVPLHGLRKLAPERPKESPRKYVEDEVTIHYRSPIRHEVKEALSEEELARRQAEAMRRIYQEERRRKYLQELQDMNSRRHTDNFTPSQKSPIPLNRYDDFGDDLSVKFRARSRSPEPRIVARALYNFVGQSARELSFRKGDIIFIRRQVDKNWFEGEHNAMIGLFPSNYVEIIPYDGIKSTPRKAHEGQARAKFNFIAQTNLELSLAKGELVVLTRRVDDNWFEGRIGSRKGIFPVSYVEILIDPGEKPEISGSTKPVASPAAHSLLLNGSAGGKESMGSHHYQPSFTAPQTTTSYHAKPVNVIGTSYSSMNRTRIGAPSVNEALHIDTQSEPVPYRALYKYRPQNDDELELQEGDTVFVLEKCDDGWYVGSSQRTGSFGTFPGNYVERI